MAVAKLEAAFTSGEVGPDLFGRFDLARLSVAASTMRNLFVRYTGGALSRGGTKFVGFSKQTGRAFPPRLITFQFSINQGLALEFGNFYMRVVSSGSFVTESPLGIDSITRANPAVVESDGSGVTAATINSAGVITSYAPMDTVTLAGGTFLSPAVLSVTNTKLASILVDDPGGGVYAPGNTINLSGGTMTTTAVLTVATTQVVSATIAVAGTLGTPGPATVTGTTGTGTKFQASVTISGGGVITSVDAISLPGNYTVNPATPGAEPVTGASLVGAKLDIELGVLTTTITNKGVFTVNAPSGAFTQASTSGSGTGATFQQGIFAPNAVGVADPGVYSVVPSNPVSQASTSGGGSGATFDLTTGSVSAFNDGDWVFISGVEGMTEVNGQTYVIDNSTASTFELFDVYGNPIDSTAFSAYTGGGTVARIYTAVSPYSENDLQFLKVTQSKDVMSIACVNQDTLTEYPPYDLTRFSNTNWQFVLMDPSASSVDPPSNVSGAASSGGSTNYQYVVTSIDPDDGTESVASSVAEVDSAVNIGATAGTITVTWTPADGVTQQNVYKALPGFDDPPPPGSQFGFVGYAFGAQFQDSNVTADFSQVPPLKKNPFARGQITSITPATVGTGGTQGGVTVTINTSTGSGAEFEAVVVNGGAVAYIQKSAGQDYADGDTVTIGGDVSGATAVLNVGPNSGTYPGAVAYFQERRVYAYSLNLPDTFWMSQPGAFKNFDSRIPTIDSDAIIGSPWSVQVDGIQFMVPMPGGLVVLTGREAWQLTGNGGSSLNPQPLTPTTQQAQPQAFNGCHDHIPPIKIDYDILYVQAKGSIIRDLSYQFYTNIYTGTDLTVNSSQLFTGFNIVQWCWCEEPYKIAWVVRNDGTMLNLCFMKPQEVAGWSRHDTNGLVQSVCAVTEPPVDALYVAVQRFPGTETAYMVERMDDRIWATLDDAWCVDCGLSLDQPTPDATLTVDTATGLGAITGVTDLIGGTGWSSATTASVIDDKGAGPGTGAVPTLTIVGGVITAVSFAMGSEGTGYIRPALVFTDPAGSAGGSGASAVCTLDNSATFTASANVFTMDNEGDVIRMGGGVATITDYTSATVVVGNITTPMSDIRANSGGKVNPQASGSWSMTTPVSSISGLQYMAGATATGVADGVEIEPVVVPADGEIDLPQASTNVVVGMGFGVQLQSVYLDGGEPTVQGQRKKVAEITARVRNSSDFQAGSNQPDGSVQSPIELAPTWTNMVEAPTHALPPYGSVVKPLYTGDIRLPVKGGWQTGGQVAVQQLKPFPLEISAFIPEILPGDTPSTKAPDRQHGRMNG